MRKLLCFLMPIFLVSCLGEKEMTSAVEEQANQLGQFLREGRFERYLDNMAYFVYASTAERNQLKKDLEAKAAYLAERGDKIVSIESRLYSNIYENEGYYQCMVRQKVFYRNNNTTYDTKTYLLAISENGEDWKFADATNLTDKLVRTVFPEMHPDLKVEKRHEEK